WLRFRGGKGVATSLGSFVLIAPKSTLRMVGIFLLIVAAFRYISLGSVMTAALFPFLAWGWHEYSEPSQLILFVIVSLLIVWKHRQNLSRMASGTESKIGSKHV